MKCKGVIHSHSWELNEQLVAGLRGCGRKILTHRKDDKEEIIKVHKESNEQTILMSPSITEGLDLPRDLSRFQIIVKVPYPNLGDPHTKARADKDPDWFNHQAALNLVQACGRSVRNDEDSATTYILDATFGWFFEQNEHLSEWWTAALDMTGKKPMASVGQNARREVTA